MQALQGEPGDPFWEKLWAEGRYEQALLWIAGGLAAGFLLSLVLVSRDALILGPKTTAVAFGLIGFGLPLFSFRGWARERPRVGTALSTVCMAAGSLATTGKIWVALVSGGLAFAAASRAYRLYNDTEFRPQMLRAAIDKAQAEVAQMKQES